MAEAAYFNDKKQNELYNTVNITNWQEVNINCAFKELYFLKDDTFYYLFIYPTKFSGVGKYGADKNWSVPEELTMIKIAHTSYEKRDWKTKETSKIEPTQIELLIGSVLEDSEEKTVYSGELWLNNSNQVQKVNDGTYDEDVAKSLKETYISLTQIEKPEHIEIDKLSVPKGYSGYSGKSSSQKESEKINDRWSFIKEQIKIAIPDKEIDSINDLVKLFNDEKTSPVISQVYDFCKDLIR